MLTTTPTTPINLIIVAPSLRGINRQRIPNTIGMIISTTILSRGIENLFEYTIFIIELIRRYPAMTYTKIVQVTPATKLGTAVERIPYYPGICRKTLDYHNHTGNKKCYSGNQNEKCYCKFRGKNEY